MPEDLKQALSHVLWIGGATDTGKTSITAMLAKRFGFQQYNYDRADLRQVTELAKTIPRYRAFLDASMDQNWVDPEPEELLARMLQAFRDRFPLVVQDLLAMQKNPLIVAEGFGLTPDLISPWLSSQYQAVMLLPTEGFKRASMQRRGKPSFRDKVRDPERATTNLYTRDMLLGKEIKTQAGMQGIRVLEVDGSKTVEEMTNLVERHFDQFVSFHRT